MKAIKEIKCDVHEFEYDSPSRCNFTDMPCKQKNRLLGLKRQNSDHTKITIWTVTRRKFRNRVYPLVKIKTDRHQHTLLCMQMVSLIT